MKKFWFSKEFSGGVGSVVYETPIRGALATAPQNMLCFVHSIRPSRPCLPCLVSAASPQGGWFGGLGAQPPVKNPLRLCVSARDKSAEELYCGCLMRSSEAGQPSEARQPKAARTPTIGVSIRHNRTSMASRAASLVFALLAAFAATAETVKVADCERDPKLDFWAAADNDFCVSIMNDVFQTAGVETENIGFGDDHLADVTNADVICSAFRTKKLLENFDFPQQPLGRMHFALYATPSRAMELMSTKIGCASATRRSRRARSPTTTASSTSSMRVFRRLTSRYRRASAPCRRCTTARSTRSSSTLRSASGRRVSWRWCRSARATSTSRSTSAVRSS